jgi:hypothetical protein
LTEIIKMAHMNPAATFVTTDSTDIADAERRLDAALRWRDPDTGEKRQYTSGEVRELQERLHVVRENAAASKKLSDEAATCRVS